MPVLVVDNEAGGTRAFSALNQGSGDVAWFGRETGPAIERLRFLRDVAGPLLAAAVAESGPVDVLNLAAQGLAMGDDVHMRTQASTNLLIRHLLPQLVAADGPAAVATLSRLYGDHGSAIDGANAEVVRRLDSGVPQLVEVSTVAQAVPAMVGRTLLHCGPAIDFGQVCDPLRRSMRAAVVAEGWAADVEEAQRLLASGDVALEPANHHQAVVPMASAIGPTAPVFVVADREGGTRS
jgi:hypothetical protein